MPVTLTPAQIESVREMVSSKTYATISSLIDDLEDAQRTAQIADVVSWDAQKNTRAVKMQGGGSGVDFDPGRVLGDVRNRTLDRLGLPRLSTGGIFRIAVGAYSDACEA